MTDYPAAIPLLAIQQVRCPRDHTRMRLTRISPGPTGFELSTFDCSKCDHVEQLAIPSDPMKSGAAGCCAGPLYPRRHDPGVALPRRQLASGNSVDLIL